MEYFFFSIPTPPDGESE